MKGPPPLLQLLTSSATATGDLTWFPGSTTTTGPVWLPVTIAAVTGPIMLLEFYHSSQADRSTTAGPSIGPRLLEPGNDCAGGRCILCTSAEGKFKLPYVFFSTFRFFCKPGVSPPGLQYYMLWVSAAPIHGFRYLQMGGSHFCS